MRQVDEDLYALLDDLMALLATNTGDKADAASVVLVRRIIKTLRRRQTIIGLPILQIISPGTFRSRTWSRLRVHL